MPFIVLSGWLGGFGPGLLATVLCTLESLYFATPPLFSFQVGNPQSYDGLGALAFSGLVTSLVFEHIRRAWRNEIAMAEIRTQLSQEVEARRRLLESIIQNSPPAIALLRGPDLTIEMVNPTYQALAPGEPMVGRTTAEVWPEAAPLVVPILKVVRDAGTVYHATGFALPRRRGPGMTVEERYFDISYVPLPGPVPEDDVRVLVVAVEVTEHKRAEAELQSAYSELAAIYANAPVVLFVVNEDFRVEKVNDLAAQFAGREGAELLGKHPGDAFGCLHALADVRGCGSGPACESCPIRTAVLDSLATGTPHEGAEAWLARLAGGEKQQRCLLVSTSVIRFHRSWKVLVCAQDITELKQTQLALESALSEKTILLKEIHHRVKNNLAVISSLLSMKADVVESGEARLALEKSQQRIHSMALVHEHLYGTDHLDRIDFSQYAKQLVGNLHTALAGEPERIAIELDLDPIELGVDRAVPCGLILNELLTNAFKYAFLGRPAGKIVVSFHESAPGFRELTVEDDGVGLPPGQLAGRNGKSLGLRIVEILTNQIDGTLVREPSCGTRIVLRFPAGAGRG
jgi:two-component sensor histidine kinase/PAS domain-containing protein